MWASDAAELEAHLQTLLAAVDAGRVQATAEDRARLEGALVVLGLVLGRTFRQRGAADLYRSGSAAAAGRVIFP